jgi:hypothetical protein
MAAPIENKNAETWNFDESERFLNDSLILVKEKEHDFIGEVARDMNQYRQLYPYLINKFPSLKYIHERIIQECESNCFSHGKKGDIVPSLAIMNLKSNHGWTDRVDQTTQGKATNSTPPTIIFLEDPQSDD